MIIYSQSPLTVATLQGSSTTCGDYGG